MLLKYLYRLGHAWSLHVLRSMLSYARGLAIKTDSLFFVELRIRTGAISYGPFSTLSNTCLDRFSGLVTVIACGHFSTLLSYAHGSSISSTVLKACIDLTLTIL